MSCAASPFGGRDHGRAGRAETVRGKARMVWAEEVSSCMVEDGEVVNGGIGCRYERGGEV